MSFARAELELQGGICEPTREADTEGSIEALLADDLARELGVPSHFVLRDTVLPDPRHVPDAGAATRAAHAPVHGPESASLPVLTAHLGEPLVERLVARATERIPVAHLCTRQLDLRLARGRARDLSLLNARLHERQELPGSATYLTVHFRFELLTDDRREGMVSATVNTLNDAPVSDPDEWPGRTDLQPASRTTGSRPAMAAGEIDRVLSVLERAARRRAMAAIRPLRDGLRRRLQRDRERTVAYFASLGDEMLEMLRRPHRGPSADAAHRRRFNKLAALVPERERKLAALPARYEQQLILTPAAAVACTVQGQRISLTVQRRRAQREVVCFHNPLSRIVDAPACECCGASAAPLALCDRATHVLCDACYHAAGAGGARGCGACS